jgi:hypothetical protein
MKIRLDWPLQILVCNMSKLLGKTYICPTLASDFFNVVPEPCSRSSEKRVFPNLGKLEIPPSLIESFDS